MSHRIGQGYDIHKLVIGRELILGGVKIPSKMGPVAHSDGDVLVHAICDGLLGALSLGDIGKYFPDSDPKFKNISSLVLLERVWGMVKEKGWELVNLDSTVVLQEPKIFKYIPKMRNNLSKVLGTEVGNISVKATTSEGLKSGGKDSWRCGF